MIETEFTFTHKLGSILLDQEPILQSLLLVFDEEVQVGAKVLILNGLGLSGPLSCNNRGTLG